MKALSLLFVVFLLAACAPKGAQKKARITSRGGGHTQAVDQNPTPSQGVNKDINGEAGTWGPIYMPSNWNQAYFQNQVAQFVSNLKGPDGNPVALAHVSGQYGQKTGVSFWGSVGLNGSFNPNGQNNLMVSSQGSALRIAIVDEYVGQTNSAGEVITEIPIYIASNVDGFVGVTGQVQGNQATILYQDSYGKIQLQGSFNSNWFTGHISFQNNNNTQGYLGMFSVQTCGFFTCQ